MPCTIQNDFPTILLAVFGSTSTTLDAEKLLEEHAFELRVVAAPSKISESCGLALQLKEADFQRLIETLNTFGISAKLYTRKGRQDPVFLRKLTG